MTLNERFQACEARRLSKTKQGQQPQFKLVVPADSSKPAGKKRKQSQQQESAKAKEGKKQQPKKKKAKKEVKKREPASKEDLDRQLDEMMGRDSKVSAKENLDADLDGYWGNKKGQAETATEST